MGLEPLSLWNLTLTTRVKELNLIIRYKVMSRVVKAAGVGFSGHVLGRFLPLRI